MWKIISAMIVVLVISTAWQAMAAPQKTGSATLSGMVIGPDDKPVAHASVSYQSSSGDAPHAVYTDRHGHFTIAKLLADNYDLRASAKGVYSEWQKNVSLHKGQSKSVTLRLLYAKEMPKAYGATPAKQ